MSKIFPGPSWTSGHVYGEGSMNLQKKFCYFHIPKCASMWMRTYLSDMGSYHIDGDWVGCNFTQDHVDDFTKIVVLRDPVERWISALPGIDFIIKHFDDVSSMDRVFNDIEHWLHDEHVARQTSFIAGLDLSKAVFFWCDQDLARNVEDFFINQGFVHTTPPPPINEQNRNSLTVDAANKWRQILSQPRYLDTFRKTFADDYKLINSVDFYKANTTKNAQ